MESKLLWIGILINMNNKNIKNIIHNDELYSSIFDLDNISEGLDFLTNDDAFVQVEHGNMKKVKYLMHTITILLIENLTSLKK